MRFLVLVLVAACGPSSAQVKAARSAEYEAPAQTVYELALDVADDTYKIGETDAEGLRFATAPQFYSKEGARQSAGAGDMVQVTEGSVQVAFVIEVSDAGLSRVAVKITPYVLQLVSGSPKPRELAPDDPAMPPWVHGRIDSLAVAIYERAKASGSITVY